jgi:hypothetical protein
MVKNNLPLVSVGRRVGFDGATLRLFFRNQSFLKKGATRYENSRASSNGV